MEILRCRNFVRTSAGVMALTCAITACKDTTRSKLPEPFVVVTGSFKARGSEWPITCFGPVSSIQANPGDTLLSLASKATALTEPYDINENNIPPEAYAEAIAQVNHLPNPDIIIAGKYYQLPKQCNPS